MFKKKCHLNSISKCNFLGSFFSFFFGLAQRAKFFQKPQSISMIFIRNCRGIRSKICPITGLFVPLLRLDGTIIDKIRDFFNIQYSQVTFI